MATNSKKHRLVRELGMYFAEKGKVISAREYKWAPDRPRFLTMKEIVKVMGSYTTAVDWIEKYEPELWNTIHGIKPEPVVEPKPAEPKPVLSESITEKLAKIGTKNEKDI